MVAEQVNSSIDYRRILHLMAGLATVKRISKKSFVELETTKQRAESWTSCSDCNS